MKKIIRKNLVLIVILFLALFLRVFLIDKMPPSLSNDEVVYAYDAFSLAKTGRDVSNRRFPLSFITDQRVPPVSIYFMALFLRFLPLTSFVAKLPFIISGVMVVILTYYFAKIIFQSPEIGMIAMILMTISPWHLQISRTAYEVNFALLFYLLAILLFMRKKFFLSLLPFFLGYHSYQGTKVIFLPLVGLLIWYKYNLFKKDKKSLFLFSLIIFIIFGSFYFIGRNQQGLERINQLIFFNQEEASEFVNYERRTSLAPNLIKKIFNNKLLYHFRQIKEGYFSYLGFLFNNGEQSGLYSLWFRGNQYFIEFFFFIFGLYFLFKDKRKTAYFLTGAVFISILPSVLTIGTKSFGTRALVGLPFLIIIMSFGAYRFLNINVKNKRLKSILLIGIYLWLFTSYLYQYYFRYPVYGAESWYFSEQKAISYLISQEGKVKKIIFTHFYTPALMRYAFTKKVEPTKIQQIFRSEGDIIFENIEFLRGCPNQGKGNPYEFLPDNSVLITKWDWDCYKEVKATKEIRAQDDGRVMWRIYEKDSNSNTKF